LNSLSVKQARKLVIASQRIHRESEFGIGSNGLIKAIEHLGYIQIDTISVVERAHHHTCWNRLKNYTPALLGQAVADRRVYEYWSHAASYLPMCDYRFSLPRKQAFIDGEKHWYKKDPKQMKYVYQRIEAEGALQASDFDQQRNTRDHAWGGLKPAKMALEQLFMQGELMISKRDGFQKVFDLTERVVPTNIEQSMPSSVEYHDHLIETFLRANGIGTAAEIAYLRKGLAALIKQRCDELVEEKNLVALDVGGKAYFALAGFEQVLQKKVSRRKVKILSPFDNLLIQRQRMRDLFDFDYQIECYVPANKRKHGYFVLPILGGQEFIGRMDAKIDRKTKLLTISKLFFESELYLDFKEELDFALARFLRFNQGQKFEIKNVVLNGQTLDVGILK